MRIRTFQRASLAALLLCGAASEWGCESAMESIDRKTLALLEESSDAVHAEVAPAWPRAGVPDGDAGPRFVPDPATPSTRNPGAGDLSFQERPAPSGAIVAPDRDGSDPATALLFDLRRAIAYAIAHGREYQNAAETYVLASLSLIIERHLWGPRFFDSLAATFTADGDDGLYDAAVSVVNDLSVRQRLPYGGEVSASLLARATEDLHQRVSGEGVQSAEVLLAAEIPLLRGAGQAAREDLIQSERTMIYAARDFERFRREYVFSIAQDFLALVVQRQLIDNAERQVRALESAEQRELALFQAGRQAGFQAGLAAQDTLFARDSLAAQRDAHRLSLDRFKLRLAIPTETAIAIEIDDLGLPTPEISMEQAVATGQRLRLDLQNDSDRFADTRRRLDVARNQLLPDLNLTGRASLPTDPSRERAGLRFEPDESDFIGGIELDLPLDREIERAQLRQAQIALERSGRSYSESRDQVAIEVRAAVREIDRAIFSIRLQEENVRIAGLREASIDAAPDRASARDRSDAIDARLRAENDLASARRDLQVSILGYLLATDQLRVAPDGRIVPLSGMTLRAG